jgi:hypothetical protein
MKLPSSRPMRPSHSVAKENISVAVDTTQYSVVLRKCKIAFSRTVCISNSRKIITISPSRWSTLSFREHAPTAHQQHLGAEHFPQSLIVRENRRKTQNRKYKNPPELGELLQICYFFRKKLKWKQEISENRLNGMQFRLFFSILPPFDDDGSSMCSFRCLDLWCVQLLVAFFEFFVVPRQSFRNYDFYWFFKKKKTKQVLMLYHTI